MAQEVWEESVFLRTRKRGMQRETKERFSRKKNQGLSNIFTYIFISGLDFSEALRATCSHTSKNICESIIISHDHKINYISGPNIWNRIENDIRNAKNRIFIYKRIGEAKYHELIRYKILYQQT